MNKKIFIPAILILGFATTPAMARGSSQHLGQSIEHSVNASGHVMVGSAKLASGVVAIPLMGIGAIGASSGNMGDALMENAHKPIGEPLPMTEEILTVTPAPNEALYKGDEQ